MDRRSTNLCFSWKSVSEVWIREKIMFRSEGQSWLCVWRILSLDSAGLSWSEIFPLHREVHKIRWIRWDMPTEWNNWRTMTIFRNSKWKVERWCFPEATRTLLKLRSVTAMMRMTLLRKNVRPYRSTELNPKRKSNKKERHQSSKTIWTVTEDFRWGHPWKTLRLRGHL